MSDRSPRRNIGIPEIGRCKRDDYTDLLAIGFTVRDVEERGD